MFLPLCTDKSARGQHYTRKTAAHRCEQASQSFPIHTVSHLLLFNLTLKKLRYFCVLCVGVTYQQDLNELSTLIAEGLQSLSPETNTIPDWAFSPLDNYFTNH